MIGGALCRYRRVFSRVFVQAVLAQSAAPVQLDVELVVVTSTAINVHTIGIICIAWILSGDVEQWNDSQDKARGELTSRVQKPAERAVESYPDLHVVVLTLGFDVWIWG